MDKIYFLSTCSTCKRIIDDLGLKDRPMKFQDIKTEPIQKEDLEDIYKETGSYEAIFNKRARKYRSLGLKDRSLSENEYRDLILKEYTFLKRPVIHFNNEYYIGNSKKTIERLKKKLDGAE